MLTLRSVECFFDSTKETHATIRGSTIIGYDGCIHSSTPSSIDIAENGVSPLGELAEVGVEYLSVQQCDKLESVDLSALDGCSTLQGIRIFRNNGDIKNLVLPSGCPSLVEVIIESNYSPVNPVDLSVLDKSPELRYLRLCKNGGSFILPSECPSLEVLVLNWSTVEDWRLDGCPELKLVMLTSLNREVVRYRDRFDGKIKVDPYGGKKLTLDLEPLLKHYISTEKPPIIYISDEYGYRVEDQITDYDKLPQTMRERIIQYSYGKQDFFIMLQVGEREGEAARYEPVYEECVYISRLYGEEVSSQYADLRPPPETYD